MDRTKIMNLEREYYTWYIRGAGGDRTHDLTDYESAALTC